jgi:murein tripeptide amidase MpaA
MLNPDGVINGNYRCSLAGVDLNRVWNDPNKKIHPTIFHTKQMIKRLMEDRETLLFCDMHGRAGATRPLFRFNLSLFTSETT